MSQNSEQKTQETRRENKTNSEANYNHESSSTPARQSEPTVFTFESNPSSPNVNSNSKNDRNDIPSPSMQTPVREFSNRSSSIRNPKSSLGSASKTQSSCIDGDVSGFSPESTVHPNSGPTSPIYVNNVSSPDFPENESKDELLKR